MGVIPEEHSETVSDTKMPKFSDLLSLSDEHKVLPDIKTPARRFSAIMMKTIGQKSESVEPEDPVKVVDLPYSGVADAKPLRPFAAPPKEYDMTEDCAYEKEWMPMKVAKKREEIREKKRLRMESLMRRKDSGAILDQIRDQEMAQFAKYRYDKGYVQ